MQYVKCGFSGENFPTAVFPCVVGRPMLRYEESLMEQELKVWLFIGKPFIYGKKGSMAQLNRQRLLTRSNRVVYLNIA